MNTGAAMADHDIHAFTPASPAPQTKRPAAPGAQRRRWPWALLVCLLALAVLAVLGALNIVTLLASAGDGWNVTINGHDVAPFFTGPEHAVTALVAAAAGLFLLLLVVPITCCWCWGWPHWPLPWRWGVHCSCCCWRQPSCCRHCGCRHC
jgi:hypothetical protein